MRIINQFLVVAFLFCVVLVLTGRPVQSGSYTYSLIADTSELYSNFFTLEINDIGTVAFHASLEAGGSGIFTGSNTGIHTVADTSEHYVSFYGTPSINNNGTVVFEAGIDAGSGIFFGADPATDTIIDNSGPYSQLFGSFSLNENGTVAFGAVLDVEGPGIFTGSNPETDTLIVGLNYSVITHISINDNNAVAFRAFFGANGSGVFTGSDPATDKVADNSGPYKNFTDAWINNSGTVVFGARLDSGLPGIFTGPNPATDTVVDTTGPYSDFGFADPKINDSGTVAFHAQEDTGIWGIFVGSDPVNDAVIKVGDSLDGSTVMRLDLNALGLNNNGDIAFVAELSDGRKGVFLAINSAVLSPVVGPVHIRPAGSPAPNCKDTLDCWEFDQHMTGFHRLGSASDETFAWDINIGPGFLEADEGLDVHPVAFGKVVKFIGEFDPGGPWGRVLLEHGEEENKWWSGYWHMKVSKTITPGMDVSIDDVIGTISNKVDRKIIKGIVNSHLHFSIYTGKNTRGNLISVDANIIERPDVVFPMVTLLNNKKKIKAGKDFTIKWETEENIAVASHDILFSIDSGSTYSTVIVSDVAPPNTPKGRNRPTSSHSWVWSVPSDLLTTQGRLRVIARDISGNIASASSSIDIEIAP